MNVFQRLLKKGREVFDRMDTDRPANTQDRPVNTQPSSDAPKSEVNEFVGTNLGWLADSPLFIDGDRIDSFYNAVVNPTYQQEEVELRLTQNASDRIKTNFGVSGELSLGGLGELFAGLLPTAKVQADAKRERADPV
jgi:hypothetical protein